MSGRRIPLKKDIATKLLLRGSAFVHLDPRRAEVAPGLSGQPQLMLEVGLDLPIPIPDLRIDDFGISGTLPFAGSSYRCSVPWAAVFALMGENGHGMVWPEDMPPELLAEIEHRHSAAIESPTKGRSAAPELTASRESLLLDAIRDSSPPPPSLRAIEGGASPHAKTERSRARLRLVK